MIKNPIKFDTLYYNSYKTFANSDASSWTFPSHITASLTHLGVVELVQDVLLHADVVGEGVEVDGGGRGHADAGAAVACRRALLARVAAEAPRLLLAPAPPLTDGVAEGRTLKAACS